METWPIMLSLGLRQRNVPVALQMSVLYLTIFVSVMLALFFVAGFIYHHDYSGGDPMRDSLLPFQKENPPKRAGGKAQGKNKIHEDKNS
jgi:hypothetical protein